MPMYCVGLTNSLCDSQYLSLHVSFFVCLTSPYCSVSYPSPCQLTPQQSRHSRPRWRALWASCGKPTSRCRHFPSAQHWLLSGRITSSPCLPVPWLSLVASQGLRQHRCCPVLDADFPDTQDVRAHHCRQAGTGLAVVVATATCSCVMLSQFFYRQVSHQAYPCLRSESSFYWCLTCRPSLSA